MVDLFKEKIKMLLSAEDKLLVAVSGGVDSIVLIHLLALANVPFAIAHCNFSLRDEESDEDAKFVQRLSKTYNVPFYTIRFDTITFAKREKISIQMAARQLRYSWFDKIRTEYKYSYIATAHHKNDVVETVLLNMVRGTGISGYHGIKEKSNNLIRPLLQFDKETILSIAEENQLKFREDSSNSSVKYSRNLIRKKVVPILKELNPSIENTFLENTQRISLTELFLNEKLEELKLSIISKSGDKIIVSTSTISDKPYFHFVIFEIIKEYGFTWQQCLSFTLEHQLSGKKIISKGYIAFIDRSQIIIQQIPSSLVSSECKLNEVGITQFEGYFFYTEYVENINVDFSEPNSAFINFDLLQLPLTIRTWEEGDFFYPLGMHGKKKLSDFFIDTKIPVAFKDEIPIITSGTDIVWVTGLRIDNRYKWLKNSTKAYKISFNRQIDI